MHRAYLEHLELNPGDIASKFGVDPLYMYTLFAKAGLSQRRPGNGHRRKNPIRTRAEVVEIHRQYMEDNASVTEFAARYGMMTSEMYKQFINHGLTERRSEAKARPANPERCPQYGSFVFCAHCPCEAPPCPEGREWDCSGSREFWHPRPRCKERARCACWNRELRSAAGWDQAWERYQREQEIKKRARTLAWKPQSALCGG